MSEPRWARMMQAPSAARRAEVLFALRRALPAECVRARPEEMLPYQSNAWAGQGPAPLAVCLPRTEAEVAHVLRVCREWDVPVVPRGAGTGLTGAALPHAAGVVLGLTRLDAVLGVDACARTLRAQAGARLEAIAQAAAAHDLVYAADPASYRVCTIGGTLATHAGGMRSFKHGGTRQQVLAAAGFTMDGARVELGSVAPALAGPHLLALALGSEGTLWVATEVTVRLQPRPPVTRAVLVRFANTDQACAAGLDVLAAGVVPAGLTVWNHAALAMMAAQDHDAPDAAAHAVLWLELEGLPEAVDEDWACVEGRLTRAGALAWQVSTGSLRGHGAWGGWIDAMAAARNAGAQCLEMDMTLPRRAIAPMLAWLAEAPEHAGLRCMSRADLGDGALCAAVVYDGHQGAEQTQAERLAQDVYERCRAWGGSVVGEYGVGAAKSSLLGAHAHPAQRAAGWALKQAWDPLGLLNPGNRLPGAAPTTMPRRSHGSAPRRRSIAT